MGLDLTLMPLQEHARLDNDIANYDSLQFTREYEIFAQIADSNGISVMPEEGIEAVVKTHQLPPGVNVWIHDEEKGSVKTRRNPYGGEMVYTTAEELRKIKLPTNTHRRNKAILAYIRALEKDALVILEWH